MHQFTHSAVAPLGHEVSSASSFVRVHAVSSALLNNGALGASKVDTTSVLTLQHAALCHLLQAAHRAACVSHTLTQCKLFFTQCIFLTAALCSALFNCRCSCFACSRSCTVSADCCSLERDWHWLLPSRATAVKATQHIDAPSTLRYGIACMLFSDSPQYGHNRHKDDAYVLLYTTASKHAIESTIDCAHVRCSARCCVLMLSTVPCASTVSTTVSTL
eukprot:9054-Heterococcus_DN1.PRE.5